MMAVSAVVGALLLVLLAADVLMTALSASEGTGPISGALLRGTWWILLRQSHRREGRWLRLTGPLLLVMALVTWVLLLWGGWTLVFLSGDAVRSSGTGADATVWQVAYYAGFSVMTLGVGDFTATGDGWRLLTVVASFSGLFVMTLSITYLLSVLSAVVNRNALALQISALGQQPADILTAGWDGTRFTSTFLQQIADLGAPLAVVAEQHLAYPVLVAFHSGHRDTALPVATAALDDAMLLLLDAVDEQARPGDVPRGLRVIIDRMLSTSAATEVHGGSEVPGAPALQPLREAGIPLRAERTIDEAVARSADRRRRLREMVEGSGWSWERP
ncbi:potassium channel family protein [Georgenia subflava]|uniref:Potassium channel domain-containing protein n=1 Tax=Georgenia subflava TaxID=1622177 RepID=A0A6N7EFK3_9MICO|nr:ion channel [Georgenia subflava]MPV35447.1 hypothetical protein [Georgenia subflava]